MECRPRKTLEGYVRLKCEVCSLYFLSPIGSDECLCMFCQDYERDEAAHGKLAGKKYLGAGDHAAIRSQLAKNSVVVA